MADCEHLDFTTTKRARLSSDCNCDQKDTPERALDIEEHHDSILTRHAETEEGVFNRTSPVQISSGEQHGVPASHERRESEDFPTCFSVEDDVDDIEEHRYQPIAGPMGWVQRQMTLGVNPEDILSYMVPHAQLPSSLDKTTLWKIIIDILTEPSPRHKLDHINSIDDVIELLRGSKNIVVLTGAGVSVSCGIPDFRSRDGIYARLSVEYPDLPDPQAMFDISYFYQNPRPFFKFAKEIYPGQFKPSLSHRFIRQLESNNQLLRNYSQNIDTLEQVAGITKIIQCHGSFSTASCTNCKYQVSSEAVREDIFNQVIPLCPKCKQDEGLAIMKPDIVFFGESLPSEFYHNLDEDSEKADLLIVIGSSLKVRPVALIPSHIPPEVPQILINREPLRHVTFDVELLGDCDVIVAELCRRLGGAWNSLLQGFEAPCVERRSSFPEMPEPGSSGGDLKLEESIRLENEQSPQTKPQEGKHTPVDSEHVTEDDACQSNAPSDTQQLSEEDASRPSVAGSQSGHVTVGESSGREETGDESHPDQPRACASTQDSSNSGEMLRFLFLPPSRYIFNGAEVMDSPLPSPSRSRTAYLDSSSDDSDSDSVGEIEDYKAISNQVDGAGGEIIRRSSGSSSNSDDGFGEGELETALEFSNAEATRQALSLILGELSSYTCESEENSRMSTSDDLLAAGAGVSDDSCHTSDATDTASASRPFSAVNMEMMVGREEQSEPKNPTQIECKKDCDSGCPHSCQDSTRLPSTVGLFEAVDDTLNSCCSDV